MKVRFWIGLAGVLLVGWSCASNNGNGTRRASLGGEVVDKIEYQKPDGSCCTATPNQIEPWNLYPPGRNDPYWSIKSRDNGAQWNARHIEYKTHDGSAWLAKLVVHSPSGGSEPDVRFGFSRPGAGAGSVEEGKVREGDALQFINWAGEPCEVTPEVKKKGENQWQVVFRERKVGGTTMPG